jgi:hypothetical protein
MPNPPEKQTVSVDELLKKAAVNTTTVSPAVAAPEHKPDFKTYMGQDGRTYYEYLIDGEKLVLVKPIEQMTEQDFYDLPISAYDAQAGRLPQNLTVEFHDPQLAGYWVNWQHKNGGRVNDARARGFVPAKKEDLKFIQAGLDDDEGCVKQNDLILMKISKAKLFMRYKEAMDIARIRGGVDHYKQIATNAVNAKYFGVNVLPQAQNEFQGLGPVNELPVSR